MADPLGATNEAAASASARGGDEFESLLREFDDSQKPTAPVNYYGLGSLEEMTPAAKRVIGVLDRLPDDVYTRYAKVHGEPLERTRLNPNAIAEFGPADGDELRKVLGEVRQEAAAEQARQKEAEHEQLLHGDLDRIEKSRMRDFVLQLDAERRQLDEERRAEKAAQQDREDFARVYESARSIAAEFPQVPAEYAEQWLTMQWFKDPEFQQTIASRYSSPQALDRAERVANRALKALHDHLKKWPDPAATEDRAALTDYMMRSGRGRPAPENNASYERRLSRMSPREYADHVEQEHGYRPNV